jgi:phage virion morphogenesis protein
MPQILIEIDDTAVLAALNRLSQGVSDPRPVLMEIGESLMESTKQRFETSTAPDGTPWAPNSEVTVLKYLEKVSGAYGKKGGLTKKGMMALLGKKPLIGESGDLAREFSYSVEGNTLTVGSTMPYAAMQQFGGSKARFPHLWGDIPARPFLGISDDDRTMIEGSVDSFLWRSG